MILGRHMFSVHRLVLMIACGLLLFVSFILGGKSCPYAQADGVGSVFRLDRSTRWNFSHACGGALLYRALRGQHYTLEVREADCFSQLI